MKYYCKECGIEFDYKDTAWTTKYCLVCGDDESKLIPIPDYETLARYHKRTGEWFEGAVWFRLIGDDTFGEWRLFWLKLVDLNDALKSTRYQYVIANPPVPPPDDFVPEVMK